jgi:hypothetical protein
MTRNMGGLDRGIRFVAGVVIIAAGIVYRSWWGLVGIVPIVTALTAWCPGYLPFRFSTIGKKT